MAYSYFCCIGFAKWLQSKATKIQEMASDSAKLNWRGAGAASAKALGPALCKKDFAYFSPEFWKRKTLNRGDGLQAGQASNWPLGPCLVLVQEFANARLVPAATHEVICPQRRLRVSQPCGSLFVHYGVPNAPGSDIDPYVSDATCNFVSMVFAQGSSDASGETRWELVQFGVPPA
ncbi:hypothetical protein B0T26DRAFT_799498 [Lasiosphaeria miniovina]|uniref:Uncharacterized protein n=1 Tax=Lasiosphaeria miniovina TaxID=1954250 RepID=A0AA40B4E0_9PEZI|nr:uncharacterized protein B0T26DRAFT_799498 [Lasiosphaeria miniovina]KAK0727495.1 hypothetical protein B0T26DRAFT_799498 [Lasiosphaeria miniovina]